MDIIFILISISLLLGAFFLGAFFWAFRNGQFDDTYTPGMRVLDFENGAGGVEKNTITNKNKTVAHS